MDYNFSFTLILALLFSAMFAFTFLSSLFFGIADGVLDIFDIQGGGQGFLSFFSATGIFGGIAAGAWAYILFDSNGASYPLLYSIALGLVLLFALGGMRKAIMSFEDTGSVAGFTVEKGDYGTASTSILKNGHPGCLGEFTVGNRREEITVFNYTEEDIPMGSSIQVVEKGGSEAHPIISVKKV